MKAEYSEVCAVEWECSQNVGANGAMWDEPMQDLDLTSCPRATLGEHAVWKRPFCALQVGGNDCSIRPYFNGGPRVF